METLVKTSFEKAPTLDSSPISYSSSSVLSKLESLITNPNLKEQVTCFESDDEEETSSKKIILDLNGDTPTALKIKADIEKSTRIINFPTQFDKKLLEAIDYCGFGSWKNVCARLSKNYTEDEIKSLPISIGPEQLQKYYTTLFLPHFKLLTDEGVIAFLGKDETYEDKNRQFQSINETSELNIEPTSKEVLSITKDNSIKYRRLRGDFDDEYDDQAEDLIAHLDDEVSENQLHHDELVPLRKVLLDSYQKRLGERNRRKRFLQVNHGVDFEKFKEDQFSTILQFSTQTQLNTLHQGINLSTEITKRIDSLKSKKLTLQNTSSKSDTQSDQLLSSLEKQILPKTMSSTKFTQLKITNFFKNSKVNDAVKSMSTSKERKLVSSFLNEQTWKE